MSQQKSGFVFTKPLLPLPLRGSNRSSKTWRSLNETDFIMKVKSWPSQMGKWIVHKVNGLSVVIELSYPLPPFFRKLFENSVILLRSNNVILFFTGFHLIPYAWVKPDGRPNYRTWYFRARRLNEILNWIRMIPISWDYNNSEGCAFAWK